MKILLANKFFYPRGGDCIHTIALKQLLEEHGHRVAVFAMQHPENLESEYSGYWPSTLEYSAKKPGSLMEAMLRPIGSAEVKEKWNRLLDDFQPDVVHLHNIHTQLSPIIAEEAWKRKIPVIWTLHDYKLLCPAYSFLREGKVCEACLNGVQNVIKHRCIKGSLSGSVIGYLEARKWSRKRLQQYTQAFIAPSQFLKQKMAEGGYSSSTIRQLYNFAEAGKFQPQTNKEPYYVYLGRLSHEKGVETLLKAASQLPQFNLKLIGDGPLRKELEARYSAANIEFMGYWQWNEIKPLLGKAQMMVIPSEWYENNPLSIIESLAVGTPVLGATIGGIPEMINDRNGLLFEAGNSADLAAKIGMMMQRTDWDHRQISEEAKERFAAGNYYLQLMDIYQNSNIL